MEGLENFINNYGGGLQFGAFFGVFAVFAIAELLFPVLGSVPERSSRWKGNLLITITNIVVLSLLPVTAISAAIWASTNNFGLLNVSNSSIEVVLIVTLLIRSLVSYVVHYLMHKVPFLWRIHRVHHTDTHLDVSTTVRLHPIEILLGILIVIPTTAFFGLSAWVLVLYEVLDSFFTPFSHANVSLPKWLDKTIRLVFVSPDMHRIHHSSYQPETDSNYGAVFSFWDRIFFTYTPEPRKPWKEFEIGLEEPRGSETKSYLWMIALPFK